MNVSMQWSRSGFAMIHVLLAAGTLSALPLRAEILAGSVTIPYKQGAAGALVTLVREDGQFQETAYTDAQGRFSLATAQHGKLNLRVRTPGYKEVTQQLELPAKGAPAINIELVKESSLQALSDALPASAHAARVQIADDKIRTAYRSQCFYCHQIGNSWTRRHKTQEEWNGVLDRMQRYGAVITWSTESGIIESLSKAFGGVPITDQQSRQRDPEIASAKLTEIRLGDASSFVHDLEIGPDGKFYSVDMGNDAIYITDFSDGRSEIAKMPTEGRARGGEMSGMSAPIATQNAYHGPHSIVLGPDGRYYTTNSMSAEIGIFDPKTRQYQFVKVGHGAVYPHTLRFDAKGILWFTIAMSNQLGRYDPKTGEVKVMDLPSGGVWQWMADTFMHGILKVASWFPGKDLHLILSHHKWSGQGHKVMNLPYGLDIKPDDGTVWYSKLYGDRIGRYDPKTGTIQEWDTPLPGPRRLRFAADGTLWIPAFGGSAIMKFDPAKGTFSNYKLPVLAEGEFETPYALAVQPKTGDVWVTSNLSDRMFRFSPKTEKWTAYPMATQTSYMRDIVFPPDGRVCSVNANLPASAIEGTQQVLVCLQP